MGGAVTALPGQPTPASGAARKRGAGLVRGPSQSGRSPTLRGIDPLCRVKCPPMRRGTCQRAWGREARGESRSTGRGSWLPSQQLPPPAGPSGRGRREQRPDGVGPWCATLAALYGGRHGQQFSLWRNGGEHRCHLPSTRPSRWGCKAVRGHGSNSGEVRLTRRQVAALRCSSHMPRKIFCPRCKVSI